MELSSEPAATDGTDRTHCTERADRTERTDSVQAAAGTDSGIVVTVTRTNPLYGHDAPLIRVATANEPDPVTAAIASAIGESGSVYLELPDGRLTVVLDIEGMTWVPRARDEGTRG
jgi:hypothetical protein